MSAKRLAFKSEACQSLLPKAKSRSRTNRLRGIAQVWAVKAPWIGGRRKALPMDLAVLTRGYAVLKTRTHVDPTEAGIVDPLEVARASLRCAASIASLLFTTEASVS